ncbi:P-loop containing nucleoside triphosphate hydrolase protein [Phlegmacium glaucopus]|nr:P-loop containing nucleoside triphosphate hydrolase protein [Phlegmacium glaucopus]
MVNISPNENIAIAVMGATGTGKTTLINLICDSQVLPVGDDLNSCTKEINIVECTIDDKPVTLIDTPGFDDSTHTETEIIRMIAHFLTHTYEKGLKLSGLIYMHRISDNRMGGLSQRNFKMFKEMCGIPAAKNVAIVTSMWDEVTAGRGEAREKELKTQFFKTILDQGAQLLRSNNTHQSALDIIAHLIGNQPVTLAIQQEIVDEHKDLDKTAAGAELLNELGKQQELYHNEINALKEENGTNRKGTSELTDMIGEKTGEVDQDKQREIEDLSEKIARLKKEAENLTADFQKERQRFQQQGSQDRSNEGRGTKIARWGLAGAKLAWQVGPYVYIAARLLAPVPIPRPPPEDIVAKATVAVAAMVRYFR